MIETLTEWTGWLSGILWGNYLTLALLLGAGLYLTIRTRAIQLRGFRHGAELVWGKHADPGHPGEVTHFQALSTALSATIGTGNIAGVATAIALGGPGALFWMWVTAFFGMATKFTESTLSLRFREIAPDGTVSGGPMYTLLHGLNMPRMAALFAVFALIAAFGIGNMVQANSVVDGLTYIWPELRGYGWAVGLVMATLVAMVILGGVRRIARVASILVPFMALLYMLGALIVLFLHAAEIPAALATIFTYALNPWAVGGAAVGEAIRWGVARGLFSNEAGLGSSAIAHAAARTKEPAREGLVAMMEPFIDTLIVCTLTGLVIVVTGAMLTRPEEAMGASLTAHAFSSVLGAPGAWIVGGGLTLFAFSTTIAWSYYGDRSARFLFGERAVLPYRIVFALLVWVGASVPLALVWNIADIMNLLMALPNLLALILLAGVAAALQREYFQHHKVRVGREAVSEQ
ncbi:alanine:cation symporter family protein [Ectothiorhodospiraceae bacterium 2226]|nr:alanine:cation symporter family protein [Ectothiorhodospiraceae bacterium 2226]